MFEFDPDKSAANKAKHGIDFDETQALWNDERLAIVSAVPRGEPRFAAIGRIGDLVWVAICTPRGSRTRLISVRRARLDEVELYENEENDRHGRI